MKPNNPFLVYGYAGPDYFCDRKSETASITGALHNGRNLTLMAPRRMGKTGLISNVFHELQQQDRNAATFYMDIYPTQNLGDFISLFASVVLGKLDSTPQKAMNRIVRFIRSCRPVFTVDPVSGMPKTTLDIAPDNRESTLKEIFEYLRSAEKYCCVAIDEFQQIAEYPEKGVEALLRSYIQFAPNIRFIFSGSKQHIMQEMFVSAKRPFYHSTQILTISPIGKEDYYAFATRFFEEKGNILTPDTFSYIYDCFDGHTWYVQSVLNRLYTYESDPNMDSVDKAVGEIVAESAYSYELLLGAYTSSNVRLLKAVAKEGCVKEINSGEFISRHNLKAASSVNTSLKKLMANELIYRSTDGYIVYDRFMGIWLRRQPF